MRPRTVSTSALQAGRAAEVRALRAEAKAWRRAARRLVALRPNAVSAGLGFAARSVGGDGPLRYAMYNRIAAHWAVTPYTEHFSGEPRRQAVRAMACLFLALEAEDEAQAIARGAARPERGGR